MNGASGCIFMFCIISQVLYRTLHLVFSPLICIFCCSSFIYFILILIWRVELWTCWLILVRLIQRFSVRCFSANSTIFLSTNKPFRSRTASMYPFAMLDRSAFSPRSSSSSSVLGTQNGSRSRSSKLTKEKYQQLWQLEANYSSPTKN